MKYLVPDTITQLRMEAFSIRVYGVFNTLSPNKFNLACNITCVMAATMFRVNICENGSDNDDDGEIRKGVLLKSPASQVVL